MKNKDIYNLYDGLCQISADKDLKFDIKTSYILAKDKHVLEPYYNAVAETRQKLLEKYGRVHDNGDWIVPKENVKEFTKEWTDFMEMENLIQLEGITLEDFKDEKIGVELMEKLLSLIDK